MTQDSPTTWSAVTGSDDYSAVYYHDGLGPPYTYEEPHWKRFFGGIAEQLVAVFAPKSAYDAGCAKGFLVRALADRGVEARGGDISKHAIAEAPPGLAERLEVKDLTENFDREYDLITCIEVLEHMSPDDARTAIANICAATDVVVLSSTPEDYTEPTHVNVRQASGWAQEFAVHGFYRRTDIDASFLSPWAVVFAKQPETTAVQLVTRYESLLQPLSREVVEKRSALLDLRRQLDVAAAPVMIERDSLIAERDSLIAERDEVVHQRNSTAAELDEFRGSDAILSRLALIDELMGVKAELAQTKVHSEQAISDAGREAVRLRDMLTQASQEAAKVKADADLAVSGAAATLAEADRRVLSAQQDRDRAVAEVKTSTSWKIGRAALLPIRAVRKLRRR